MREHGRLEREIVIMFEMLFLTPILLYYFSAAANDIADPSAFNKNLFRMKYHGYSINDDFIAQNALCRLKSCPEPVNV